MNHIVLATQMHRALQLYAGSLPDEQAVEVASIYMPWEAGKKYRAKEIMSYGVNSVGDPQLYRAVSDHTSQADWLPDQVPAMYTPIGLDEHGYPIWAPPTGAQDAYNTGDIVSHGGKLYKSLIDGNCTVPGEDGRYWEAV